MKQILIVEDDDAIRAEPRTLLLACGMYIDGKFFHKVLTVSAECSTKTVLYSTLLFQGF